MYKDVVGFRVDRAVQLISRMSPKPVYYYELAYQGGYSFYYLPGTNNTVPYGTTKNSFDFGSCY
jgi:hypothetical protein